MTRALLCSVFLLSLSCSSSPSDNGSTSGSSGESSTSGGSGTQSGAGSSSTAAGAGATASGGAGNGFAGAGGASGTAGAGGTATAGGAGATVAGSVTQWGNDIARSAHWVDASLTQANVKTKMAQDTFPAPTGATTEYAGKFAGELAALPLYLAGATAGAGEYIAVTTQNDVYAFHETTGALVWKHNVGANIAAGGSLCGTPTNHGIVGTPVIDATARVIYLVAGIATPEHHEIHALNADTGMELTGGWPVDVSKIKAGTLAFDEKVQNQRSALSLVNGVVYASFGGYCGDQGDYHGWVIGVNSKDPTKTGAWATIEQQAGIWAPGGMASDGTGVFAVTGNSGIMGDHTNSDSEEIIRVTGLGVGMRDTKDMFFPSEWATPMNAHDLDFGSSSPAVITVPNSTPSTVIVAPSKNGRVYFLDAGNLGASLGQFADMAVADTTGASVYTAPSAYTSASGVHVAITTGAGSQCPGTGNDGSVMSILMQPGMTPTAAPTPKISWCAAIATDATIHRSPISTNSSGSTDPIVWLVNGTKLNAFDGETGASLYTGGTGTCGGVHAFTTLIDANGHLIMGGDAAGQAHLCSWSVHN
jgi:hypothetical protein